MPVVKRCLLDVRGLLHSELTAALAPRMRPVEDQSRPSPSPEWGGLPCHELPSLSQAPTAILPESGVYFFKRSIMIIVVHESLRKREMIHLRKNFHLIE